VHARETAKKIAASPIVEQEGELCFTLYNAAGDCVLTSTGIIIHVGTMGAAIKYMIENNWESNPASNPVTCSPPTTAPSAMSTPATSPPSCRSSGTAS
jgi:N-methylhydantoinase B/oxoprolinase/acetone carboxylase alpha subunit